MRFLAVKNWRTFQHYSDRRPPWIKLYVHLLDDLDHMALPPIEAIALMRIWLMAARFGHPLPNDPRLMQNRAGVAPTVLARLVAKGWLLETDDASTDDSTADSADDSALTRARPRVPARASARSREGEVERENRERTTPAPAVIGSMDREGYAALKAYRDAHRHPEAFERAIEKLAVPITGNGFGWEIVGKALVEMRANGKEWHAGLCAGYCKRLKAGDPPSNGNGKHRRDPAHVDAMIAEGARRAQEAGLG